MQTKVNNRYREYAIALPQIIAEDIKKRAKEANCSEGEMIKRLIAKGLVSAEEKAIVTE